ncbi:hypothetical protein ACSTS3_10870 [Aquimarina muelleri]|uniref:hypothetical protein n=1 Tax=Aquimarina muelleri TaxID=279356 RepID=UPI003F686CA4
MNLQKLDGEIILRVIVIFIIGVVYGILDRRKFKATYGDKETLICLDVIIIDETVEYFKENIDQKLVVLERALDTTKKWNLKHAMGDKFNAF